eukprot:4198285-Pyramimonas_sp.AAC.1
MFHTGDGYSAPGGVNPQAGGSTGSGEDAEEGLSTTYRLTGNRQQRCSRIPGARIRASRRSVWYPRLWYPGRICGQGVDPQPGRVDSHLSAV